MGSFTLEISAIGQYISDIPTLEVWNDGILEDSALIPNTGVNMTYNLSFTGALPSMLEFSFNDALSEVGRTVALQTVKINGRFVNKNNYLGVDTLSQSQIASVDILSAGFLFDASEPDISIFQPSDGNFTVGADEYRNYTSTNHIIDAQDGRDTIYLGSGADKVYGNDGDDIIYAGANNDLISGGQGADSLHGELGDDEIYGGVGNDRLYGKDGNDSLFGGADDDRLFGHAGNDLLVGNDGNDRLIGSNGQDILYGDAGNDILVGGNDNDTADGGIGDDVVYGGSGDDILNAGAGNDKVFGQAGNDILFANEGDNTLDGSNGNDVLYGGEGTNILKGGNDNDVLISNSNTLIDSTVATILSSNVGVSYNVETNSFYQLVTTTESWGGAQIDAQAMTLAGLSGVNGYLVNITSQAENDYVESLVTSGDAWIGASDQAVEGAWSWAGGSEAGMQFWSGGAFGTDVNNNYSNWGAFEPTNISGTRDFASISSAGEWDVQLAVTTLGYVVEWDAETLISTAANTTSLIGQSGYDELYGSDTGVDIFVIDNLDAVDRVYGFDTSNRDQLDISALIDFDLVNDDISEFIQLTESAGHTTVSVDSDGTANGTSFNNAVILDSVTGLDIYDLISGDNFIV